MYDQDGSICTVSDRFPPSRQPSRKFRADATRGVMPYSTLQLSSILLSKGVWKLLYQYDLDILLLRVRYLYNVTPSQACFF